jgi:hypothetical protein
MINRSPTRLVAPSSRHRLGEIPEKSSGKRSLISMTVIKGGYILLQGKQAYLFA